MGPLAALQAAHREQTERHAELLAGVATARKAEAAAEILTGELGAVRASSVAQRDELLGRDEQMARELEQVNSAVMTNAESVGQELRARSQALAALDAREASTSAAVADQAPPAHCR